MIRLAVGSLTMPLGYHKKPRGAGLTLARLSPDGGTATVDEVLDGLGNPAFLARHPSLGLLYAIDEQAAEGSFLSVIDVGQDGPAVTRARHRLDGIEAVHVGLAPDGRHAAVAHYGDPATGRGAGLSLVALDAEGMPRGARFLAATGTAPHPHHAAFLAPDRLALTDLGGETVTLFRIDAEGQAVPVGAATLKKGSGPRHLALHPGKRHGLLVLERGDGVQSLSLDAGAGMISAGASTAMAPPRGFPSGIAMHPSGHFAVMARRGSDTLHLLALHPGGGAPMLGAVRPAGGRGPRDCAFDPSGRLLFVACLDDDRIVAHAFDGLAGRFGPARTVLETGSPAAVLPF